MPTTRGWAGIGAAFALGILWAGFGEDLLLALAAFLFAAVAGGSLYVRYAAPRLVLKRAINPVQLHDGERALVDLTLESR